MKFSEQWLREWVNPAINSATLAEQLTMAGLEVDSINPTADDFSGVVVGYVQDARQHPDADRLRVCTVDIGAAEPVEIVCGGTNVRAGLKVPVATIGAVLANNFKISKSKLRGVVSSGMICAAKELGLYDHAPGIIMELLPDAPVGQDFRDYLQLNDHIIEIELTPNRGDCLSILGVAREVAAINSLPIQLPEMAAVAPSINDSIAIKVTDSTLCPRYLGRVIRKINVQAITPLWMQEKLRRSGLRSIHPVVDVTNYVMLELGQPLHAFDLAKLNGAIEVRLAQANETIQLLDGQTKELTAKTLVIADSQGPQAMAGIMGGEHSAVSEHTQDLFLEAAHFSPSNISVNARHYGLQSDSSYRFERGVDADLPRLALERATQLLLQIVGGQPGPVNEVVAEDKLPLREVVCVRRERVQRLLGIELSMAQMGQIFKALNIAIIDQDEAAFKVKAPGYRFDLSIEADFIEEIARIYGYDRIASAPGLAAMPEVTRIPLQMGSMDLAKVLADRGYREVITYSFVDPKVQALFHPEQQPLQLINPLAQDMAVMRHSLWPGLMSIAQYNLARQAERLRIFETGMVFNRVEGEWQQQVKIGGLVTGSVANEQWGEKSRLVDFFDLKGEIEALLIKVGYELSQVRWAPIEHPALHPGQSAGLYLGEQILGHIGAIHPSLRQDLDLGQPVYLFELDQALLQLAALKKYQPISKFPAVRRDLAMIVDQGVAVGSIKEKIQLQLGNCLKNLIIFDIYEGQHIEKGKKSVALGLVFQDPERTLVDEEINQMISQIVSVLERDFNIKLRM